MPIPQASIKLLNYELNEVIDSTPEADRLLLTALTAINHLGAFGVLLRSVSLSKLCTEVSPSEEERALREFDHAMIAVGDVQAGIAATADDAVRSLYLCLTAGPSEKTGEGKG